MPKFGTRLVWIVRADEAPKPASQAPDLAKTLNPALNFESPVKIDTEKQRVDLKNYYDALKLQKGETAANQEFDKKLKEWDNPAKIESLRTAGVNATDDETNFQKRHLLLSNSFLKENGEGKFKVDFKNNYQAEWKVGLADIIPPNILAVSINRVDGTHVSRAVRGQNPDTHRIGYFESNGPKMPPPFIYAYIHSGDEITFLDTKAIDPKGDASTKNEHEQIYKNGAAKNTVNEPHEIPGSAHPDLAAPVIDANKSAIKQLQQGLGAGGIAAGQEGQRLDVSEAQARIVKIAQQYAAESARGENHFRQDFLNSPNLRGGIVGCARVSSTILRDAGVLDKIIDGVEPASAELEKRNWQRVDGNSTPEPGWVVVWVRGPTGHKHIGVVTQKGPPIMVVDNDGVRVDPKAPSVKGGPVERTVTRVPPRAVEYYLRPPESGIVTAPGVSPTETSPATNTLPNTPQRQPLAGNQGPAASPRASSAPAATGEIANRKTANPLDINADHKANQDKIRINPDMQTELARILPIFEQNRARYDAVAAKTGFPAILICVLDYRESGYAKGKMFTNYLHTGEQLGQPRKGFSIGLAPKSTIFNTWEEAAVDALLEPSRQNIRKQLGIDQNTTDMSKLMTFAEIWQGTGARRNGRTSSYVYAGTNLDSGGMFVADSKFDTSKKDPRPGAAAIILALSGKSDFGPQQNNSAVA